MEFIIRVPSLDWGERVKYSGDLAAMRTSVTLQTLSNSINVKQLKIQTGSQLVKLPMVHSDQ